MGLSLLGILSLFITTDFNILIKYCKYSYYVCNSYICWSGYLRQGCLCICCIVRRYLRYSLVGLYLPRIAFFGL